MAEDTETHHQHDKDGVGDTKHKQGIDLPPHWFLKVSRSRKGRIFYANKVLKKTTWELPSFTPCQTPCDECQKYKARMKKQSKKIKKTRFENSAHSGTGSEDVSHKVSSQKSMLNKVPTDSVTKTVNINSSKKLKKLPIIRDQTCNSQQEHSRDIMSTLQTKHVGEIEKYSSAVHHLKNKVSRKKKSQNKWKKIDSSSSTANSSREDFLQRIQNDETVSSTSTAKQIEGQCEEEIMQKRTNTSDNSPSSHHLPFHARLPSCSLSPCDAVLPKSMSGTDPATVSFEIATPNKLSLAKKRCHSSDEDFTDNLHNFKRKKKQSRGHQSKLVNKPTKDKPAVSDKTGADNVALTSIKLLGKSSEDCTVDKTSVVLPTSTADEDFTLIKTFSKNEFTTNKISSINLNALLSSKVVSSENSCRSSTISQADIASDMCMEVDIATELQTIRRANSDHTVDIDISPPLQLDVLNASDSDFLYVVVDTNVLISRLHLLNTISQAQKASYKGQVIVVVIPYTALQELDSLKSRESLSKKARAAIRWCHDCFTKQDAGVTVRAQSFANYKLVRDTLHGSNGDDHIRDCCLYLQQQQYSTILLSDDINLRNKALVSDIKATDSATLNKEISYTTGNTLPSASSCTTALSPSPAAVSRGDRRSAPYNTPARPRHQTYVVRRNKRLSSHQSLMDYETNDTDDIVTNTSICNEITSIQNDVNSTSFNLNEADDTIIQSRNNSVKSPDVSMGLTSLFDTSRRHESTSNYVRSSTPSNLTRDTYEQSLNYECEENALLKSLETTLGNILKFVMEKEYGNLWIHIIKHKPPWTLSQIFDCWIKHWMAAFMDKFPRAVEQQLKQLDRLTHSRGVDTDSNELERCILKLYKIFNKAPFKDLVQLPENCLPEQDCEETNCSNAISVNDKSNLSNGSLSMDDNENVVSSPCFVSLNSTYPPEMHHQEQESIQAAKDLIVMTGTRMGQFVTEGVSFLSAGPLQPALLNPLNSLRDCINSLTASFIRCKENLNAASADKLSAAILQFWCNAQEGEEQQQRFVTSEAGRAAVRAFMQSTANTDFTTNCLQQLQTMAALLDAELKKATQMQTL